MLDPLEFLAKQGAQGDVIDGLRGLAPDWETLYAKCPRGDWLLGIAVRLGVDHALTVRAAAACARTALDYAVGDATPNGIDVAERWSRNAATPEEIEAAKAALDADLATPADPATEAAAHAALAVLHGIGDPDALATAANAAATATIVASLDCGLELAMGFAHAKCADAVRGVITFAEIAARVPR